MRHGYGDVPQRGCSVMALEPWCRTLKGRSARTGAGCYHASALRCSGVAKVTEIECLTSVLIGHSPFGG
mgnify:CR=1 FL=1|jgi:hypothetical protein